MKRALLVVLITIFILTGCSSKNLDNQPVEQEPIEPQKPVENPAGFDKSFDGFEVIQGIRDDVLGYPLDIYTDKNGYIYVIDAFSSGGMIKKFSLHGEFVEKFGSASQGLKTPVDLTSDSGGNLYVADLEAKGIHVFDSNGNYKKSIKPALENEDFIPRNIEILSNDNLVVLNFDEVVIMTPEGKTVRKFGDSGSKPGQFGAEGSEFYLGPNGLAVDTDDNIYVADTLNNRIQIFNSRGDLLKVITNEDVEGVFGQLLHIDVDSSKNIYVTDSGLYHVLKLNQKGEVIKRIGGMGSKEGNFGSIGSRYGNYGPTALSISKDDLLYVVDVYNHRIQCFDSNGEFMNALGRREAPEAFIYPKNVDVDHQGAVYIVGGDSFLEDPFNFKVLKLDAKGNIDIEYISGYNSGEFVNPQDVCSYEQYVYVLDLDMVQKFHKNGEFDISFGGRGEEEGYFGLMDFYGIVKGPAALCSDAEGSVYVADKYNNRIQKFDASGRFVEEISVPKPQTLYVKGQSIFVVSAVDGTIYKYDIKEGQFDKFINTGEIGMEFGIIRDGTDVEGPQGLAVDEQGFVYVSDTFNNRIIVFSPQGEIEEVIEEFGEGETFKEPKGLAFDDQGNLYVADFGNHRIIKLLH